MNYPDIHYTLNSLENFNPQEGEQHPCSLWNLSFGNVQKRLSSFMDELITINISNNSTSDNLTELYESLLHALCKLWEDDTNAIIKTFRNCNKTRECSISKDLKTKKRDYLTKTAKIINAVKHNQEKICPYNILINEKRLHGFTVLTNRCVGWTKNDNIHYKKNDVAFSFAFETRRIINGIYLHGYDLNTAIKALQPSLTLAIEQIEVSSDFSDLINKLSKIPQIYFPNELNSKLPTREKVDIARIINQGVKYEGNMITPSIEEQAIYSGDGVTRKFPVLGFEYKDYINKLNTICL